MNFRDILGNEAQMLLKIEYDKTNAKLALHFSQTPTTDIKELTRQYLPFVSDIEVIVESSTISYDNPLEVWEKLVETAYAEHSVIRQLIVNAPKRVHENEIVIDINDDISFEKIEKLSECRNRLNELINLGKENYRVKFHHVHVDPIELEDIVIKEEIKAQTIAKTKVEPATSNTEELFTYRKFIKRPVTDMGQLDVEGSYCVEGIITDIETRELKEGKTLLTFILTDFRNTVNCKMFLAPKDAARVLDGIKVGGFYRVDGTNRYDTFESEFVIFVTDVNELPGNPFRRTDNAPVKRVELHLHSNMSEMDAINSIGEIIKKASKMGHKAIAVTDHGVLQAFPDAMGAAKANNIKMIYGVEAYIYNDEGPEPLDNDYSLSGDFVVFDLETTGLSPVEDRIIEIGAVKIRGNEIIDTFSILINPMIPLSSKIVELTGITDEMLKGQPYIAQAMSEFKSFVGDLPLIAHNASFDMSFVQYYYRKEDIPFDNIALDTLKIGRLLLPTLRNHRLNTLAKFYSVSLENHHRAVDDCTATARIYMNMVSKLAEDGVATINSLYNLYSKSESLKDKDFYHAIILVKNYDGLRNLYEMVSHSHIETFYRRPRIPKSLLKKKREGLILGTACEAGEVFKAVLKGKSEEQVIEIADFYDYMEVQPLANNLHLIGREVQDKESLRLINSKIYEIGAKLGKLTVATGDVHFFEPHEEINRRIIVANKFADADSPLPLYYRTTDEMLREFEYFGKDVAYELVVENTNKIADMIEDVIPIPNGTFPPVIEGSDTDLRKLCYDKAYSLYGENLPEIVQARLERELTSIIDNGYAVMYMIAHKLVKKSLEDGYLVGSRGSVGSSFAATMSDITEVNPLPAHYMCPVCKHSEFIGDSFVGSGADLPDKSCPKCSFPLKKEGHDIPFETFLGFEGDKEPDIDLNFAGVYQATSHKYTEELFGKGKVYKAGTIGTLADKSAFGYAKKYFEERNMNVSKYQVTRLAKGCTGIRRTTGQHPGGIMVVPSYKDVHDFTPINYPANDPSSGVITTHFDYHSISGRILKLDILGHDVPTIIRQLETFTGIDVTSLPLDDRETLKIFTSTDSLGILDDEYKEEIGSLGIPEFGTKFVRQMLKDTQPTTFTELVLISGLSHGTNVWINNAHTLVKEGTVTLKDVISTRDDIMLYLIKKGLPPKESFNIMERVRKGKKLTEDNEALMKKHKVPSWYIESCNKIEYMFPKAHAVAYVMMSFRIAYFKVHHPLAFYATYFTTKVESFDAQLITLGKAIVKEKLSELRANENNLSNKEGDLLGILEVAYEMNARGYEFLKVDLYESHYEDFLIKDGKILPPLRALAGVGESAAKSIWEQAKQEKFISKEDFKSKTKATKTAIEALEKHGALSGIPETNQLQFFDLAGF